MTSQCYHVYILQSFTPRHYCIMIHVRAFQSLTGRMIIETCRVYKEQCIAKTEVDLSGLGINIAIYVYILCLFISTDTMILLNYMYSQGAGYLSIQKRSHRSSCQCYEIKIIIQIHRLHPHITSITQSLPPRLPKLSAEKDPPLLGGRPCPDWVQTNRHSQLLDR